MSALSLSARRAWIEMANALPITSPITKSLSARRAWIEIPITLDSGALPGSLSARRAWIEISVTRYKPTPKPVALRKESVDRNKLFKRRVVGQCVSLSARRAWIEIPQFGR